VVDVLRSDKHASGIYFAVLNTRPRVAVAVGEEFYPMSLNRISAFVVIIEGEGATELRVITHTYPALSDLGVSKSYTWEVLNAVVERLGVRPVNVVDVDYMDSSKSSQLGS
jgi:L-rhamnose isomerase